MRHFPLALILLTSLVDSTASASEAFDPDKYYGTRALLEQEWGYVDLETNGNTSILQRTHRHMNGEKQVAVENSYYKLPNGDVISKHASKAHKLSRGFLKNKATFKENAEGVADAIDGKLLVTHGGNSYDGHILRKDLEKHLKAAPGKGDITYSVVDTLAIARCRWNREKCRTDEYFPSPKSKQFTARRGVPASTLKQEDDAKKAASKAKTDAAAERKRKREVDGTEQAHIDKLAATKRLKRENHEDRFGVETKPPMGLRAVSTREGILTSNQAANIIQTDAAGENKQLGIPVKRQIDHDAVMDTRFGAALAVKLAHTGLPKPIPFVAPAPAYASQGPAAAVAAVTPAFKLNFADLNDENAPIALVMIPADAEGSDNGLPTQPYLPLGAVAAAANAGGSDDDRLTQAYPPLSTVTPLAKIR